MSFAKGKTIANYVLGELEGLSRFALTYMHIVIYTCHLTQRRICAAAIGSFLDRVNHPIDEPINLT